MALASSGNAAQTWSSGSTFILAAIGAAVGLGNIWKFPYVVGVSGGGAFVIVYLLCVFFIAIPILIGELLIGRRGHSSPPVAMAAVAEDSGRSRRWSVVGWMGMIVGFLIVTYYSVIAGWTLIYIVKAGSGFGGAAVTDVASQFDGLLAQPGTMSIWHGVFMLLTLLIVGRGLQGGIEKAVKVLMPALFAMLIAMIVYAGIAGDLAKAVSFLFNTDFSKITGEVVLLAIGQAFFSIGVAMGLMMVYGAYVPKNISLTKSAVIIATADTLVALLAGLMIFPIVFANGLDPASGPGLIFKTLPTAFANMPGGSVFGALFFLLLAFAAVTSLMALIEPMIAYSEDKWAMKRSRSCTIFGVLAFIVGLGTVFSFNIWSDFTPLAAFDTFAAKTIFDLIDYVTANLFMPLGGILIALFVGWRMKPEVLAEELTFASPMLYKVWLWMMRVVAPLAILAILVGNIV